MTVEVSYFSAKDNTTITFLIDTKPLNIRVYRAAKDFKGNTYQQEIYPSDLPLIDMLVEYIVDQEHQKYNQRLSKKEIK